ncbi:hypothetical protein [Paenibacillus crassostreae]|nr:hypothetical protein [Paenibacillus crassostreae]
MQQQSSIVEKQNQQPTKRSRRLFSRKHKFTAGLLAALMPGLGHIYLSLFRKGISFIFVLILDISALLYFSSVGIHINVPFLILLALIIPIMYFYSLFDALQAADYIIIRSPKGRVEDSTQQIQRHPFAGEKGHSFGIMLVLGGIVLILFHQKPMWLGEFIELYGEIAVALGLVLLGFGIGIREMVIHYKR